MTIECSFCMFDDRRPADPDDLAETEVIVIINGHSTCLWHSGYAQGGDWTLALAHLKKQNKETT